MFTTKFSIGINGVAYELEIYQLDKGVVTAFKFDGRIFLDAGKNKQAEQKGKENKILEIVPYNIWTQEEDDIFRKTY